jgi:hypothetical protein
MWWRGLVRLMTESNPTERQSEARVRKTPEQVAEDAWMSFEPAIEAAGYALKKARGIVSRAREEESHASQALQETYRAAAIAARRAREQAEQELAEEDPAEQDAGERECEG